MHITILLQAIERYFNLNLFCKYTVKQYIYAAKDYFNKLSAVM